MKYSKKKKSSKSKVKATTKNGRRGKKSSMLKGKITKMMRRK